MKHKIFYKIGNQKAIGYFTDNEIDYLQKNTSIEIISIKRGSQNGRKMGVNYLLWLSDNISYTCYNFIKRGNKNERNRNNDPRRIKTTY